MKYKLLMITVLALTFSGLASAAESGSEVSTGFFTPDSALYPVQLTVDEFTLSDEEYVVRRAAETEQMIGNEKVEAAERSVDALDSKAEGLSRNEAEGLSQAESVLNGLDVPSEAEEGLSNALSSISDASSRSPEDLREEKPEQDDEMDGGAPGGEFGR